MKIIERIVKSPGAPNENDLWLDESTVPSTLKEYCNGAWRPLGIDSDAVRVTEQNLTDAEKLQARTNIGAGTVSESDIANFVRKPGSEHVTVKIRGCEWDSDNNTNKAASVTGGKVVVKAWNPATAENCATREFTIPAPASGALESVVEFDIEHGLHYQVHSEVSGLGASFRLSFTSTAETREVLLWNISLGTLLFGYSAVTADDENYRMFPVVSNDGAADIGDYSDWDLHGDEYSDDSMWNGVLVSTATGSFVLCLDNKSDSSIAWSKMNYGRNVPALEEYYETNGQDYSAAINAAKGDYDGPLNTDKIVTSLAEAPAAYFCVSSNDSCFQRYLPSVGELNAIYLNKTSINNINTDASVTTSIDTSIYWSSCAYDRYYAFYESLYNGTVNYGSKYDDSSLYGLAVSAFLYYY